MSSYYNPYFSLSANIRIIRAMKSVFSSEYLDNLKKKARKSRIKTKHQLIGLEIAMHLEDEKHKSLYMKMAKEGDMDRLLTIAKDVGGRKIKNKGGYFMRVVTEEKKKKDNIVKVRVKKKSR